MMSRLSGLARRAFMAVVYSTSGAVVVSLIVFVVYMNGRPDLAVWHLVDLDEEFSADSKIDSFAAYIELEERVFKQLDELVAANDIDLAEEDVAYLEELIAADVLDR